MWMLTFRSKEFSNAVTKYECSSPEFEHENNEVKSRIRDTQEFVSTLTTWSSEMLKLPTSILKKVLKLGASIKKVLR